MQFPCVKKQGFHHLLKLNLLRVENLWASGQEVSLEEWLALMSKEGVGVHPYAFDGRQTPFFGADVHTWIFGWCAASDRCRAPGTLQERLSDMTCGPLLRRFKSTATALSTCGTPDAERGRRLRDVLASDAWKLERLGEAGAGLSDGQCWACGRTRRLAFVLREDRAPRTIHRIGCQCAAQLGQLETFYGLLKTFLTGPMPTTAEALEEARRSLAAF